MLPSLPLPIRLAAATLAASLAVAAVPESKPARSRTIASIAGDPSLRSVAGKDFDVIQIGADDAPLRFFVQGGLHGNEETASRFVAWLAKRYARGESMLNLLPKDEVAIDFLPHANPDGTQGASRYNDRGVNLNRNFDVLWGVTRENPGEASFSEPETRAIRALFRARKYAAAVDVHGYVNWIVAPSSFEQIAEKLGPAKAQAFRTRAATYSRWMTELKEQMPVLANYQLKTASGLGDGGAFEDWAFWSEGTLAYCLELETFQRFVRPYRADFADITKLPEHRSVDLFARYEAYVYRMFDAALRIKRDAARPESLAAGQ